MVESQRQIDRFLEFRLINNQLAYVDEVNIDGDSALHAGPKARRDVAAILERAGAKKYAIEFSEACRRSLGAIGKLKTHREIAKKWHKTLENVNEKYLLVQFPLMAHTLFAKSAFAEANKKGIHLIALVHDLDCLRYSADGAMSGRELWRIRNEELDLLDMFDAIIVHNYRMAAKLNKLVELGRTVVLSLDIFDYLVEERSAFAEATQEGPVVIAGNLAPAKASYLESLPPSPHFRLYGQGFASSNQPVEYMGAFGAEDLVSALKGSYGLVWDGHDADTCSGEFGEYMRINNPHKLSLYLAAGLPVIVWDQAAIAEFVKSNGVGIVVSNLYDISVATADVSAPEYDQLCANARAVGESLRIGTHTARSIADALEAIQAGDAQSI